MVLDESEVSKNKYINVLVGDTAEPEKTYVVVETVSINTLSQQRLTTI